MLLTEIVTLSISNNWDEGFKLSIATKHVNYMTVTEYRFFFVEYHPRIPSRSSSYKLLKEL